MSDDVELGKELRAARLKAGLSRTEVSKLAGVAKATISRWERGKNLGSVPHVLRLIRLYEERAKKNATR